MIFREVSAGRVYLQRTQQILHQTAFEKFMATFKELTDFFQQVGAADVSHTTKSYLAHAIAVHGDLRKWGCDEELQNVGLFHSIYGTERFQRFTLPLERRDEVKALIGERAEWLSYLNCAMDRAHFDNEILKEDDPEGFLDRYTGEVIKLSSQDEADLNTVHLCDWLEQVGRSKDWNYRRAVYRRLAERLGGVALESYDAVYASESA